MKRNCFLLKVKKELLQEYKKAHELVWPEMLKTMRDAGIRNYSQFHNKDGLLVGYLEADDPEKSLKECVAAEAGKKWHEYMLPFFEPVAKGFKPLEPEILTEYFYME